MSEGRCLTDKPGTIHATAEALASGETTSVALCTQLLARYTEVDGEVRAFLHMDSEGVLAAAAESDARRAAGKALGRFDGVPIAIKDNIAVSGQSTGCASKLLEGFVSPYDATVVARLRAEGFVMMGRANMDEFAMGSTTENSAYTPTRNPANTAHVPGGSSGGSAAAVASGQSLAALGSDTGGSIRQPAGFCGIVGFKPTYGRISRYGLVAFASSLDQIGPLTHDVQDAALLLDVIGGYDGSDSTCLDVPCEGFEEKLAGASLKGLRVGLPREYVEVDGLSAEVRGALDSTCDRLRAAGAEIVEVSLPRTRYAVATYYVIATAEASSNLARFDGIRYGDRATDADDLIETYLKSREQGFGDEVKRRIILGTYVLSSGYYDAYYLRAQQVRTLIREDYERCFEQCDVIMSPVAPTTAPVFDGYEDPLHMYLADIYTIPVNLAGNCGLSLPVGVGEDGMPLSVQLVANSMCEETLLGAAYQLEKLLAGE